MPIPPNPLDPSPPVEFDHPCISVGRHTYGLVPESFVVVRPWETIEVGSFCSFAKEVVLFSGAEHDHKVSTFPLLSKWLDVDAGHIDTTTRGPLRIGSDCWVGWRAMVMSGVTVGHGAIVGAGSVVVRDVPAYSIVAGNPARVVRMRFDDQTIERFLKVRWWEWEDEAIAARADLFSDVPAFLDAAENDPPVRGAPQRELPATASPQNLYLDLVERSISSHGGAEGHLTPERLQVIRECVDDTLGRFVRGDVLDTNAGEGGAGIVMSAVLAVRGAAHRSLWLADARGQLTEVAGLRQRFAQHNLLNDRVKILEGPFDAQMLPNLKGPFSFARLDGSDPGVVRTLEVIYPAMAHGALILIEDCEASRDAVETFRRQNGITKPIREHEGVGIVWQNG